MKNIFKILLPTIFLFLPFGVSIGQNSSYPRPGYGSSRPPRPSPRPPMSPQYPPGFGRFNPDLFMPSPMIYTSGEETVICCGYDAMGIWRTMPLKVSYTRMAIGYDVEVLSAWNPWSNQWDDNIDVEAVATSYYLNGTTYRYYVVLSTGTFYFNL